MSLRENIEKEFLSISQPGTKHHTFDFNISLIIEPGLIVNLFVKKDFIICTRNSINIKINEAYIQFNFNMYDFNVLAAKWKCLINPNGPNVGALKSLAPFEWRLQMKNPVDGLINAVKAIGEKVVSLIKSLSDSLTYSRKSRVLTLVNEVGCIDLFLRLSSRPLEGVCVNKKIYTIVNFDEMTIYFNSQKLNFREYEVGLDITPQIKETFYGDSYLCYPRPSFFCVPSNLDLRKCLLSTILACTLPKRQR